VVEALEVLMETTVQPQAVDMAQAAVVIAALVLTAQ
jgi:hypothetical protein